MPADEFVLRHDGDALKGIVAGVAADQGLELVWRDDWTAEMSQGSRTKSVLFGAFAPFLRVVVAIRSLDEDGEGGDDEGDTEGDREGDTGEGGTEDGGTDDGGSTVGGGAEQHVVRLDSQGTGMLGGVMGAGRTRASYAALRDGLRRGLEATGSDVVERDPGRSRLA